MKVRREEVLRYLGHKNQEIDEQLKALVDSCILEIKNIAKPLYTYGIFDVEIRNNEVKLRDSTLSLMGSSIVNHLKHAKQSVILAATLGAEVDRAIKKYQLVEMTRAVVLDACATETIESLCDGVEEEIKRLGQLRGYHITSRYSPGYGDFALDIQPRLLKQLEANARIGLTCTNQHLLVPRKSVTAVIGLTEDTDESKSKGCGACGARAHCRYKREDKACEFSTRI